MRGGHAPQRDEGRGVMRFAFGERSITINIPDRAVLLAEISDRMAARRSFGLVTMNVDHLEKLRSNPRFVDAYLAHDLVVADGNPIVWLCRLAGQRVGLVPGSEIVVPLCELAARHDVPLAIVAGEEGTGREAAARLEGMIPGLRVVLITAPSFPFHPDGPEGDDILRRIAVSGAGLCLLGVGAPRQEILAARGRRRLPAVGFASVGAGIDFIAGRQRRAPLLVRRARMEWMWRAASSPLRLGPRYLKGFAILPGHLRRALATRAGRNLSNLYKKTP